MARNEEAEFLVPELSGVFGLRFPFDMKRILFRNLKILFSESKAVAKLRDYLDEIILVFLIKSNIYSHK